MRIALVHDWLTGMRGGEKVLLAMAREFPEAELFTLFADTKGIAEPILRLKRHTSFLQKIPGICKNYRTLLPLMPKAIESFDFTGFNLILSSSHCVAKGVRVSTGVPHICYCHSPMRYAWQQRDLYLNSLPSWKRMFARPLLERLRRWDERTASRVTLFLANGKNVQQRIRDCYQQEATILYPPVDTDFYDLTRVRGQGFYLVVAGLVPNKRTELAIEACNQLDKKLIIIGSGPEQKKLEKLAGRKTTFLGWQSDDVIRTHYQTCKALLFPGEDDFGIVPLEAQATGTPVIAFGQGGALETVLQNQTGLFFREPTDESLAKAIEQFEARDDWDSNQCRQQAERFSKEHFSQQLREIVARFTKPSL